MQKSSDDCECEYCARYRPLYNNIKNGHPRWITISPRYSDRDPEEDYRDFKEEILEPLRKAGVILGVAEMTDNLRLHYHLMLDEDDKIRSYKIINKTRGLCQVAYLRGLPEKGLHYLFKDMALTGEYIQDPVFTTDSLSVEYRAKMLVRRLARKVERKEEYENSIPDWMLDN